MHFIKNSVDIFDPHSLVTQGKVAFNSSQRH